jgi:protein-disulfide isomerase
MVYSGGQKAGLMTTVAQLHLGILALTMSVAVQSDKGVQDKDRADAKPLRQISMPVTAGWYSIGSADAPLTLMEFTDYECPLCRAFHADTFGRLKTKYIDTGRVRFVSRDQPLSEYHPRAMDAAHAVRCAGDQGRFWELRDSLIVHANHLSRSNILEYARRLRLDPKQFSACLSSRKHQAEIDKDLADAVALDLRGTPTFVLGRTSDKTLDGVVIVGALPYAVFEGAVERMLAGSVR